MLKLLLGIVVVVVVLAGAGLALVFAGVLDSQFSERGTVGGQFREVVVRSDSGNVRLTSGSRLAYDGSGHYLFERPKLQRTEHDGVLTLAIGCENSSIICNLDLRVTVPAGIKVTVDIDSGDVHADGVDVSEAHLKSDSGDVHAEVSGRQSLVWAHSDSGGVSVDAADAAAIDAQTDSGDVEVDAAGRVRRVVAHSDSGDVEVAVPGGEYAVRAETDSGDVEIEQEISRNDRAPRSIEAGTDSGDVKVRAR